MGKLSDDYIAGFVDGEGCFAFSMRRDVRHERKKQPVYYSWKAMFAIVLREDDKEILEAIKKRFNCGSVTVTKTGQARYQVTNLNELSTIIVSFFKKNRLFGKKRKDFELWSQAVKILIKYKRKRGSINLNKGTRGFLKVEWEQKDIDTLNNIKQAMLAFKSKGQSNQWTGSIIGREKGQDIK